MTDDAMPPGMIPSGSTPVFTEQTLPDGLRKEHKLADGTWGVLRVLEGTIRFTDLETDEERSIASPDDVTIRPGALHQVATVGPVQLRIDFYREPESGAQTT